MDPGKISTGICPYCTGPPFKGLRGLKVHIGTKHPERKQEFYGIVEHIGQQRQSPQQEQGHKYHTSPQYFYNQSDHGNIETNSRQQITTRDTEDEKIQCPFCGLPYTGTRGLKVHMNAKHPDSRSEYDNAIQRIEIQDAIHSGFTFDATAPAGDIVSCQYCGKLCKGKAGITSHTRQMHPDKYQKGHNDVLDTSGIDSSTLKASSVLHCEDDGKVSCPFCTGRYNGSRGVKIHISSQHPEKKADYEKMMHNVEIKEAKNAGTVFYEAEAVGNMLACQFCGKLCNGQAGVTSHTRQAHPDYYYKEAGQCDRPKGSINGADGLDTDCPFCPETTEGLKNHTSVKHPEKKYKLLDMLEKDVAEVSQCPFCPESFNTDKGLKVHTSDKHPDKKSKLLEILQREKVGSDDEDKNSMVDGIIPCSYYGKACKGRSGLTNHIRQSHKDEYEQDYHSVNLHKDELKTERHKDSDPEMVPCPYCDALYKGTRGVNTHIRAKHPGGNPLDSASVSVKPKVIEEARTWSSLPPHTKLHSSPPILPKSPASMPKSMSLPHRTLTESECFLMYGFLKDKLDRLTLKKEEVSDQARTLNSLRKQIVVWMTQNKDYNYKWVEKHFGSYYDKLKVSIYIGPAMIRQKVL